jgi:hypothetical protein
MNQHLDAQGEAREALSTAVSSYGQRVLNDPHTLGNLVADLLPDLPRERSLLVTGAEAGVAAEMRQHVEEQRIDPDTAVQLVARALSERRSIDPAAGLWVASEYAQALGYQVRPYASAVFFGSPPQASPPAPEPQRPPGQFWQPSLPQQPWAPAGLAAQSWPPAGAPPQAWPPIGPAAGQSWPPPSSSGGSQGSWSGRRRGLVAAATAVVLIGGYLIAATFAHTFPFTKSRPVAAASAVHSPRAAAKLTRPATPAPTGPTLAAGVTPLTQLLPEDIDDPTSQCQPDPPPYTWDMPGRVADLACNDPGLPKGKVYAFQMDSQADFVATWQSYSKVVGFTESSPGQVCPPAKGGTGTYPTDSKDFPARSGQVLWCEMVDVGNGPQPTYTWTVPSEDAFFVAAGAPNSSFAAMDKWFSNYSLPLTAPSSSAPRPSAS